MTDAYKIDVFRLTANQKVAHIPPDDIASQAKVVGHIADSFEYLVIESIFKVCHQQQQKEICQSKYIISSGASVSRSIGPESVTR